ncbi:unnamed protein product [Absidia cylindrospora]
MQVDFFFFLPNYRNLQLVPRTFLIAKFFQKIDHITETDVVIAITNHCYTSDRCLPLPPWMLVPQIMEFILQVKAYNRHVWRFIDSVFDSVEQMDVRRDEACSMASAARKIVDRTVGSTSVMNGCCCSHLLLTRHTFNGTLHRHKNHMEEISGLEHLPTVIYQGTWCRKAHIPHYQ